MVSMTTAQMIETILCPIHMNWLRSISPILSRLFSLSQAVLFTKQTISNCYLIGRADYIGGIDNEALDFGPLEPFVHVSSSNGINNAPNNCTAAITLSVTAITTATTPTQIPLVTASVSPSAMNMHTANGEPPSHLPESPPDSGSEPPYSPADLHAINTLNQVWIHMISIVNRFETRNIHQTHATSSVLHKSLIALQTNE